MDIRYQVFVSSTFADLEDERAEVIRILQNMDCIPSGMELFPAADEQQFQYIKRVIDDSDYYLLIIAGRYGSLSPDGVSYTELEYDYAVEKGIKVIALLHKWPDRIEYGKTEKDPESLEKLRNFREKVSASRMVNFWENKEQLPGLVSINVQNAIKMFPSIGWVRSNRVSSEKAQERILELEQENLQLREKLRNLDLDHTIDASKLSSGEELYEINYSFELRSKDGSEKTNISESISLSWDEIFYAVSNSLMAISNNSMINMSLAAYIFNKEKSRIFEQYGENATKYVELEEESISTILIQFRALGFITFDGAKWRLTNTGNSKLTEVRTIKSSQLTD